MLHNNGTLPQDGFAGFITLAHSALSSISYSQMPTAKDHGKNATSELQDSSLAGYGCHRNRVDAATDRNDKALTIAHAQHAIQAAQGMQRRNQEAGTNAHSGTAIR